MTGLEAFLTSGWETLLEKQLSLDFLTDGEFNIFLDTLRHKGRWGGQTWKQRRKMGGSLVNFINIYEGSEAMAKTKDSRRWFTKNNVFYPLENVFPQDVLAITFNSFALIFERQNVNHITLKISNSELDLSYTEWKYTKFQVWAKRNDFSPKL